MEYSFSGFLNKYSNLKSFFSMVLPTSPNIPILSPQPPAPRSRKALLNRRKSKKRKFFPLFPSPPPPTIQLSNSENGRKPINETHSAAPKNGSLLPPPLPFEHNKRRSAVRYCLLVQLPCEQERDFERRPLPFLKRQAKRRKR